MEEIPMPRADEILPNFLYLGSYRDALREDTLAQVGIRYILNVKDSCRFPDESKFHFLHVPLSDYGDQDLAPVFQECFPFIQQAAAEQCKILFHCSQGINRAPTIVIGNYIESIGLSISPYLTIVISYRLPDGN